MTQGSIFLPTRYPAQAVRVALLVLLTAVTGCGWQLRGHGDTPQYVDSLYIGGRPMDNELKTELERSLRASGIELKDSAKDAQYSLVLLDQRSKRRTATLSGQARVSEQELSEELKFTVRAADGAEILPPTAISDERVYEYDENNVLATDDEAQLLRREMRTSLVRQLLNYLQRIGPRAADKAASTNAAAP